MHYEDVYRVYSRERERVHFMSELIDNENLKSEKAIYMKNKKKKIIKILK